MSVVDVLIATALEMERDAVRNAADWRGESQSGVRHWEEKDTDKYPDYLFGEYVLTDGSSITVALARPTRMGGIFMSNVVSTLMERLNPRCLAMCGVCAGNPSDLALGDVAIANTVFQYDEGKRTAAGLQGDLFPTPMNIRWVQRANELRPDGLPSYGDPSQSDASLWLLERLCASADPTKHPAFARYFPPGRWLEQIKQMERRRLVRREGRTFVITDDGKEFLDGSLAYKIDTPSKLPFAIKVGPIASGNTVVKDGVTWDMLKGVGQRSAIALEMEAASIGVVGYARSLSNWIVVKGVMDHADPNKDDRYKPFAARASAEVLLRFLEQTAGSMRNDGNSLSNRTTPLDEQESITFPFSLTGQGPTKFKPVGFETERKPKRFELQRLIHQILADPTDEIDSYFHFQYDPGIITLINKSKHLYANFEEEMALRGETPSINDYNSLHDDISLAEATLYNLPRLAALIVKKLNLTDFWGFIHQPLSRFIELVITRFLSPLASSQFSDGEILFRDYICACRPYDYVAKI